VVAIHNQAPPGSLNDYETNWGRYTRQQPDNTKLHLGPKTGHQGHVHTLPSLRGGPNGWAGGPDVHGMVDKEVVRALLERQDINGLHLLLSRAPAFQENQPDGLTAADHEWALHRQRLGDMVPMNTLYTLVMRCCFRCDHTIHGEGGHSINNFQFPPSVQEQAGLDRSIWDTRWDGAGLRGKSLFWPSKQLASRVQLRAPPTSPPLPLVPTLTQEYLTQFTCSLVLDRDYMQFQTRHVAGVDDNNC